MTDSENHGVWKCLVDMVSWEGVLCVNAKMRSCTSPESEGSGDGVPEAAVGTGIHAPFKQSILLIDTVWWILLIIL